LNRNEKFLSIIAPKVGCGYVFGSQGETMTKERLSQLVKTFGRDHYYGTDKNADIWLGKQCFDCSGLIVWTLIQMGLLKKTEDYTANSLFSSLCKPVDKASLKAGDLCFVKSAGAKSIEHVGVYMGDGQVVHARGTKYGVVKTAVLPYFNVFGRVNMLQVDDLKNALDFISSRSGIDKNYWYLQAKQVKWLEECFIGIAKGFGGG